MARDLKGPDLAQTTFTKEEEPLRTRQNKEDYQVRRNLRTHLSVYLLTLAYSFFMWPIALDGILFPPVAILGITLYFVFGWFSQTSKNTWRIFPYFVPIHEHYDHPLFYKVADWWALALYILSLSFLAATA